MSGYALDALDFQVPRIFTRGSLLDEYGLDRWGTRFGREVQEKNRHVLGKKNGGRTITRQQTKAKRRPKQTSEDAKMGEAPYPKLVMH
jgi:hypothetical protein